MQATKFYQIKQVETLLNPSSIALFGASNTEGSVGYILLANLLSEFEGTIYAINPKHKEVLGIPCVPSVDQLDQPVDLAVVATPFSEVPEVLHNCVKRGISTFLILSDGTHTSDKNIFDEIVHLTQVHQLTVLGPNCIGILNPWKKLNMGLLKQKALPGNIAFISQSVSLSNSVLDWANKKGIGFSGLVSIGSKLDVDFADLIAYFGEDENTRCILMCIENIEDGKKFLEVASRVSAQKPIIALKSGKNEIVELDNGSHTGAMVRSDMVYDAAFDSAGIVRAGSMEELFELGQVFLMPVKPKGPKITILSNSRSPALMATDVLVGKEAHLATLMQPTLDFIKKNFDNVQLTENPIALRGYPDETGFKQLVEVCAHDEETDTLIVLYSPQLKGNAIDFAQALIDVHGDSKTPIIACWMGESEVEEARLLLTKANIPNFNYPEKAVKSILRLLEYKDLHTPVALDAVEEDKPEESTVMYDRALADTIIQYAGVQDRERLTEVESKQVLSCYKIATPHSLVATDAKEAAYCAAQIGFPVVMKILTPDIGHKIDVNGVLLNINDINEAESAYERVIENVKGHVPDADIMGVLVEKMIHKRYELWIGAIRDAVFGPVIVFGLGGSMVKLWNDVHLALAPLSKEDACHLLSRSKANTLLSGFRGMPPIQKDQLVDVLVNFSNLINDLESVVEVDINPFAIDEQGGVALDAHILIA